MSRGQSFGLNGTPDNEANGNGEFFSPFAHDRPEEPGPESLFELLPEGVQSIIAEWLRVVNVNTGVLYQVLKNPAEHHILTAITNDVLSLIRQVDLMEGRAAALLARTTFEHLVNFLDVHTQGAAVSERFLAHKYVTADQVARRVWHLEALDKGTQRKERNKLRQLAAQTKKPLANALQKYSSDFTRGWSDQNLFTRAQGYGLQDEYDAYKLLSGVVHGASGSLGGIAREAYGQHVYRIGSDMELSAVAFEEGLRSYQHFASRIEQSVSRPETQELEQATKALLDQRGAIRKALRKLDMRTQPSEALAPNLMALVKVYPSGKRRWYLYDGRLRAVTLAKTPNPEPPLSEFSDEEKDPLVQSSGNLPRILFFADLLLEPCDPDHWVPAASVIDPVGSPEEFL